MYLLLILRLDLRNMPDMLLSASGSSKTAATTTKKSSCTASSTGFFTLPHARCSALHPQLPPTESSKQLHARFWQKSSYSILSADPPVFPLQVWPYHFLNLHLWHLHPQKPRLYKCIFEVKNPVCQRAYGIHLVVSQAPHVGKSPASIASRGHVIIFRNPKLDSFHINWVYRRSNLMLASPKKSASLSSAFLHDPSWLPQISCLHKFLHKLDLQTEGLAESIHI